MVSTSITRSMTKAIKIEECEHILAVLWDRAVGDTIDLVTPNDCTTSGMTQLLKHALE